MTTANVTLIVDDQDARIQYLCPVTKETVSGSYFHDTWTSIGSLACGQNGWFKHTFNGTQTRIWGSASQINNNYSVKIDDGAFVEQSGDGFYESPVLSDGLHTVVYAAGDENLYPAFDYLTVIAGPSTQLLGRTVIVDDAEISEYTGKWSTQPLSEFLLARPSSIYLNTTHWTNTVGDTFTFQFDGDSVAVSGLNSSAVYILDGVSTVIPIPAATTYVQPMIQLFRADLEAGTHTLIFNVTEVAPSHVIGIDFVLYNSSVDSLPPASSTVQSPTVASKKTNHTRIIVATTLGSLAAILLLALFFFLRRTRVLKSKSTSTSTAKWDIVTKVEAEK
ncbi:hypothetical protein B0H10DRAFT_2049186 [Mycena sp. CBHHK59/15]|nr:hypothetical protein B0H10DRAFT_2049186 [Mycena sp. CBHHK59/15]